MLIKKQKYNKLEVLNKRTKILFKLGTSINEEMRLTANNLLSTIIKKIKNKYLINGYNLANPCS